MNQFFERLEPGYEKVRYNFTFCERPDLHMQVDPLPSDCPLPSTGLPSTIYVRVERQALIRLPRSGAVLFTIRTYRQNIADVARRHRAALLATLEPGSTTTPLSAHQKDLFRERLRARFAHDDAWIA